MKKSNILQLLEMHVDKIVLGLMTVISLVLLWMYVLGNPYGAQVGGRKLGPGQIDTITKQQSDELLVAIDQPADASEYFFNRTDLAQYDKLLQCPISQVASLSIPYPGIGEALPEEDRIYDVPRIEPLTEVAVASLRGAAQIPTDEVRPDMPYQTMPWELGDVDLVTVSAKFNIQALTNSFQQSFTGPRLLKTTWKDASLAKPLFAQLRLERREQLEDGTWGEWTAVNRTKIDMYKSLLESVPLTTDQLQYDMKICMGQYSDKAIQRDILQPQAYMFAISRTEWQPPVYLQETLDILKKQQDLKLKQQREDRAKLMNAPTTDRRPETARPNPADRRQQQQQQDNRRQPEGRRGVRDPQMFEMGFEDPALAARPPVKRERTVEDVKNDLKKVVLDEKTDPETMREALLVWAHDDSTTPGKSYQYRLRLGVFNPIAGKNWFRNDQSQFKDQVVLWSAYTEPTEAVFVQKRIHVFPIEMIAADANPDGTQGVKVEVAKYNIGQWKKQTFDVFPGQIIGQKAEVKPEENLGLNGDMGFTNELMGMRGGGIEPSTGPQIIDFTTPFTLVDINRTVNWGSGAQSRKTYDLMLYYDPEKQICQAAIGKNAWDGSLRKDYTQVEEEIEQRQQMLPGSMPMMMPGGPRDMPRGERLMPGS